MAASYRVNSQFVMTAVETLDTALFPAASSRGLVNDQFNDSHSLNSASAPPVTKAAYFQITSGTSGSIDLTALTHNDTTVDTSGLKLQEIIIKNDSTGVFSIVEGASNGYALGVSSAKIPCAAGGNTHLHFPDVLSDVAAGDKTIDWTCSIAPTGSATVKIGMIFG